MKRFIFGLLALVCLSGPASAASCYVSEFIKAGDAGVQVAIQPAITDQAPITVSASSAQSAAFNANTRLIRLNCDVTVSYLVGANPVVTTSNARSTGQTEYFQVSPGQKIAVISNN